MIQGYPYRSHLRNNLIHFDDFPKKSISISHGYLQEKSHVHFLDFDVISSIDIYILWNRMCKALPLSSSRSIEQAFPNMFTIFGIYQTLEDNSDQGFQVLDV